MTFRVAPRINLMFRKVVNVVDVGIGPEVVGGGV